MEVNAYAIEHEVEKNHWWFVGRRYLFGNIIKKLKFDRNAAIVDIGSSSGTNLRLLKDLGFSNYHGLDISEEAKKFCAEKQLGNVHIVDIQNTDLSKNSYDFILATDVLEHLADDCSAVSRIYSGLKSGGYLLVTVPCFKCLWGQQDIVAQHLRRYYKSEVEDILKKNNFGIIKSFYFNFLLFIPILIARKILLQQNKIKNENEINNAIINSILKLVFIFDCWISSVLNPPFGVSALILAKKP